MFKNAGERQSRKCIDSLHASAERGEYSPLATSIIGRLTATDIETESKKAETVVHLFRPRKWNDESIGLAVSNMALQHQIDTRLLAQTKEQTMRTESIAGSAVLANLEDLHEQYQLSPVDFGFSSPFEVKGFGETLDFADGHTVWVYYRPIVFVDEVYAKANALTTNHVETMAKQINRSLLSPAIQRPVW